MTRIAIERGRVAGLSAAALAEEFGTPLYVYDFDAIERRVALLRSALPPTFELAYAAKANPSVAVLGLMGELGLGLDIASGGELLAATRAGVDPSRIVFTGPGKRDTELRAAAAAGLRAVTVESAAELDRLERAAADAGRIVPVLLRVALDGGNEPTPILSAGWRKFGIDPLELERVAQEAHASPWIEVLGLHAFGASNVTDADAIAAHVATTVDLAASVARRVGFALRLVDGGGGLGVAYRDADPILDLDRLGTRLAQLGAGWAADPDLGELPILLEPGRYLTAPCGLLLARVVDRKRVGGRTVAIIDTGIHHALRPILVGGGHRLQLLPSGRRPAASGDPLLVGGPLCTGLDLLPGGLAAEPEPGDLVAIEDLGAYGYSESMPFFLSHPIPAEMAIRGGQAALIRERIEPEDLLVGQCLPQWRT